MAIPTSRDRIVVSLAGGAGIAGLAAASLLLPFAPVYDPWAWLVWGRELAGLDLDTAAGPSWKPLPVITTMALAPASDAAPELWLAAARAGWLAAAALAWILAARLAVTEAGLSRRAGVAAGALAALGFALVYDSLIPPVRQFAGGLAEPLLAAVALGAIERGLGGHHRPAVALAAAAALLRPEAWPFGAAYAVWLWRRDPGVRPWIAACAAAVPALWFGPDLAGSGAPLTGAERARGGGISIVAGLEAAGRGLLLAPLGLSAGAAVAVAAARRRRRAVITVLAAGAVAWIAVVAAMAVGGYAGLARFSLPAGAIVCVLGAVGIAGLFARASRAPAIVAAFAVAALLVADGAWRAAQIPSDAADAAAFASDVDELFRLVDETGAVHLTTCGEVATTDLFTQTALAWRLDRTLSQIGLRTATVPTRGIVLTGPAASEALRQRIAARGDPVARRGPWVAYALSCATATSSAGERRIAGVAGAAR